MPRRTFKRIMPDPENLRQHKYLKLFGPWMQQANIWHLNRRSASGALALGILVCWIPIPFQMVLAAFSAIVFGVNLPLAVATVWVSNPLTMPVMFYSAYLCGASVLGWERTDFNFELSWHWLAQSIHSVGPPMLFGCALLGAISAIFTYFIINSLWRYGILFNWRKRQRLRADRYS
ncbi:DUF2062 domain-containing protein [uncultured Ferrimonas sp.]|uniref:DUF2062 domain-containing protein n=1 Tax=uncultured Ferrimonas sp. TaxID=432640 RepID=UPI00262DCD49|nr:DUF2062 domain-containing protein [uncultured Ferrimonas sp.]